MKSILVRLLLVSSVLLIPISAKAVADDPAPAGTGAPVELNNDLKVIVGKIQEKAQAGKRDQADYGPDFAAIDALIAKHKGEKTEEVAQMYMLKAEVYGAVLGDNAKVLEIFQQIKADLPDTTAGKNADKVIAQVEKQVAAEKLRSGLVAGSAFPSFAESDVKGAPVSPAKFKGKIVMVDFWATWCGPCVHELPNVIAAYQKYHDKGFEIVGVSLDKSKDDLTNFVKEHQMPWQQYCDGLGWENKLAQQYGITAIPATFLLDGDGKIIATDLRGPQLAEELEKRLAK